MSKQYLIPCDEMLRQLVPKAHRRPGAHKRPTRGPELPLSHACAKAAWSSYRIHDLGQGERTVERSRCACFGGISIAGDW